VRYTLLEPRVLWRAWQEGRRADQSRSERIRRRGRSSVLQIALAPDDERTKGDDDG
jgi:hypothetical protein